MSHTLIHYLSSVGRAALTPPLLYRRNPPWSCRRGGPYILASHPPNYPPDTPLHHDTFPADAQIDDAASKCLALQKSGQDRHDRRPSAALLLARDNGTQLMSSLSLSYVRHAECELARNAADNYCWDYLAGCTMVSAWEPCAMRAATLYWSHIGRLVYLASEQTLQKLTDEGNTENLTLDLPCHQVFRSRSEQS
ncbi:uncharacterized protein N7482_003815 [Penicillium canariense]|uniref:CMP/dCMP-type deaminase domain-containing protein n=1 Tax=Penicillium canariense TaxID=189055 RepID=A0A9W9LPI2_9EURO|nr:uncharacterized protein N7482_003815 [Penicillium canariense]KAJ5168221.1 hypothetical protein N7482_003815 [Penicillium canariense]